MAAGVAKSGAIGPRRRLSRAAHLHLIDQLSRWGGSGLALFAGVSIFIAIVPAREMPIRTAVWASLILVALYMCRRYRKDFRRGDRIAARPFRWRAYYAATLAVVSTAFGAGAFLIAPDTVSPVAARETMTLIAIAAAGAAAFNAAHPASAIAAGAPALFAAAFAAARLFGLDLFTISLSAGAGIAALSVFFLSRAIIARAASRFPRTTFLRREIDRTAHTTDAKVERAAS